MTKKLRSQIVLTSLKQMCCVDFVKYLETVDSESVTPDCFDECLKLAVKNHYFALIGVIMLRKPSNAKDCLDDALTMLNGYKIDGIKAPDCSKTTLVLLLCYAVEKHLNGVIKAICENNFYKKQWLLEGDISIRFHILEHLNNDEMFVYPVRIGCNHTVKNYKGVEYILNIFCDKENYKADWKGLWLRFLHEDWFKGLTSFKNIILSCNKIKSMPINILNYLGAVEKLNLSSNKLQVVPLELFRLPNLHSLNLSSNQLKDLPNVKEWSPFFTILALENNLLESFPLHVEKLKLKHLYLADNRLKSVPESICNLKCLETLDISRNVDINTLPQSMGKLSKLIVLGLEGLKIRNPDYSSTINHPDQKSFHLNTQT
nr:leucine-rich repeat and IQ domain-containing protein 4-like [Hydra vulgaris]